MKRPGDVPPPPPVSLISRQSCNICRKTRALRLTKPGPWLYNDGVMRVEVSAVRSNHAGLWRVIYIARGEKQARNIEELLRTAGFMVGRKPSVSESEDEDIEIRALDSEAEEARLYLMEQGY